VPPELPPRGVLAAADGVGVAEPFLDEVVIEQPDRDEPLLDRGVRQPAPESIETTLGPRRLGLLVSSRTNTATWARLAVAASTFSRSQTSRYSARPRA
jgi:hypothetical protein